MTTNCENKTREGLGGLVCEYVNVKTRTQEQGVNEVTMPIMRRLRRLEARLRRMAGHHTRIRAGVGPIETGFARWGAVGMHKGCTHVRTCLRPWFILWERYTHSAVE